MDLPLILLHLPLFLSLSLIPPSHSSCDPTYRSLLSLAFSSVSNFPHFPTSPTSPCSHFLHLHLPSRNLSGTVSWMFLRNISTLRSLDLSGNSLRGSIPGGFWSSPSLTDVNLADNQLGGTLRFEPGGSVRSLNLSKNRFTNAIGIAGFSGVRSLDLSHNHIGLIPKGLVGLGGLKYLDFSNNHMAGKFPGDFPELTELHFLNVSFNNLSGKVDLRSLEKFGKSAFVDAGELNFSTPSSSASASASVSVSDSKKHKSKKRRKRILKIGLVTTSGIIVGCSLLGIVYLLVRRIRRRRKKGWKEEEREVAAATAREVGWVVEARWGAAVMVFEKPLMELTFGDLAAATSGFGRESQLTEGGRIGPAYRAVLPGEWHVVIRVAESARGMEEREAAAAFREMARLRHPNLLPLLGYCIPGREKLLLYEYMERGDLHQWLHGLPPGDPNMDQSSDIWEPHRTGEKYTNSSVLAQDWPARHKIALGVARGLAFLHQGWVGSRRPVVHGHLAPSNILLDGELEPRIADFWTVNGSVEEEERGETVEGDVYSYGVLVMELVTGRAKWTEEKVERVRKLVREGKGPEGLDPKIRMTDGREQQMTQQMVECLRVGYLCTAEAPEKRPTMQQVVGLLKDIRPSSLSSAIAVSATSATTSSSTSS